MNASPWLRHQWTNRAQTALLVLALVAIGALAGWALIGPDGALIAVLACVLVLLVQPALAPQLTLRLYRAQVLPPDWAPGLWRVHLQLAERAGLAPAPTLHYVPSPVINAFAVGRREDAAIALTDGLLRTLSPRELVGVLGHELAHIVHDDLRVMGLADYVSRLTSLLALVGKIMVVIAIPWWFFDPGAVNWLGLAVLVLAPHLALFAQLGLSRVREFDADLEAVRLTGDPIGLASALVRIEQASRGWRAWVLPGWGNPDPSWLRTHPATEERVRRLRELAQTAVLTADFDSRPPFAAPTRARPRWYPGGFWR